MKPSSPSTNGANGRDAAGRFTTGNPGGPGNPHAQRAARLRSTLMAAVTEQDMADVARVLIDEAKGGNMRAIKELLDRTLGRPQEADLVERIEELESRLERARGRWRA